MKKNNKKYLIFSFIIIVVVAIFLTSKNIKENRKLNFFEKTIKDTTSLVINITSKPFKFIHNKNVERKEKNKMYKEYKKLKEEAKKANMYKSRIKELEKEVETLEKSLKLNDTIADYKEINAEVINRNVGKWYNTLNINKGSKAGIKNGMAVIVSEGLIGKVINVSNFTSTVKLLTTDELSNKISIKIETEEKSLYGLLTSYNNNKNIYLIEGISSNTSIKKGDKVVTTGLSEIFPSGILVGTVKKVTLDKYELATAIEVTPSVDFDDIKIVTVLDRDAK